MASGDLLSYFGAGTGIAGLLLSVFTLYRTERVRSVDRSVVVDKALATLRHRIVGLPDLLLKARRSYEALAAAEGRLRSGATEAWLKEWDEDRQNAQTLVNALPVEHEGLSSVSFEELARRELIIHKVSQQVDVIEGRYRASMASDEKGVERRKQQIAADARTVRAATAWTRGPLDPE